MVDVFHGVPFRVCREPARQEPADKEIGEGVARLKNGSLRPCGNCGGQGYGDMGQSACSRCGGIGVFDTRKSGEVRADPVFDPAITLPDPYDEGPGPWYDGQKVKEIERTTGIKFEAK